MTTSYVYPSAFGSSSTSSSADDSNRTAQTASTLATIVSSIDTQLSGNISEAGSFASFVCHLAKLDESLRRGEDSVFFGQGGKQFSSRTRVGYGTSFLVDKVEIAYEQKEGPAKKRLAVVKTVRQDSLNPNQWRDVLLEIRVLLHEPIRYHPNIVRLLDVGWGAASNIGSPFPALVQEYADYGTLDKLQRDNAPLSFKIKQKLCYDVGRGLSILHACGIVHGDVKHENILVFINRYDNVPEQPYTAKVADFGGTVLDLDEESTESHRVPMHTFPYEAPEISQRLTIEGVKKTDAFSYGMLIWRCMMDCDDMFAAMGLSVHGRPTDEQRAAVQELKTSEQLLTKAAESLGQTPSIKGLPKESLSLILVSLAFTLRGNPAQRNIEYAQASMRGMDLAQCKHYIEVKDLANTKAKEGLQYRTPGAHGIDVDSTGYALGRMAGDDYDPQNNMPGYRPDLPQPTKDGYEFEPWSLGRILDWDQQTQMLTGFTEAANMRHNPRQDKLEPWSASFFLYQSCLYGFGTAVDAVGACKWLRSTAKPSEEIAGVDYLAGAWLARVHKAFGVVNPLPLEEQLDFLRWGTIRGHRHCLQDANQLIPLLPTVAKQTEWRQEIDWAHWNYRIRTNGTGMPYFISRRLFRKWDTEDLAELDQEIRKELGDEYDSCLRVNATTPDSSERDEETRFDKINVSNKGHGLLHLAASLGRLNMLQHIYTKYNASIDRKNHSHSDTPLVSACKSGHLDCALYLLENGASPDGWDTGEQVPLHCLMNFEDEHVGIIVNRLVHAGAKLERLTSASRKDVRAIISDWEDTGAIVTTALGRAVIHQKTAAVKALLEVGADPWHCEDNGGRISVEPIRLAALLTLPELLLTMLGHAPENPRQEGEPLFDECGMLQVARSRSIMGYDPLTLQSRVIRCGASYKADLKQTLTVLQNWRFANGGEVQEEAPGAQLCHEISLGNDDIVETMLELGHDIDGSPRFRPIRAAVEANNDRLFQLLVNKHAKLSFEGEESLLLVSASRPRYRPRGEAISSYLIAHGVSTAPLDPAQPSVLALAIQNRYFEHANQLISHGIIGGLNSMCLWAAEREPETLLGYLLSDHTNDSLQSIEYLAKIHASSEIGITLQPEVKSGLSALHLIALQPMALWNNYSQISARIVQQILDMFPDPESLRTFHIHDEYGTPLTAAILASNQYIVGALLESPFQQDASHETAVEQGISGRFMPLKLVSVLQSSLRSKQEPHTKQLAALVDIYEQLGAISPPDISSLSVSESSHETSPSRAVDVNYNPALDTPVDLSVISEELPTFWKEGDDMSSDQAMRTILKSLRTTEGFGGNGIDVLMDKTFNKRPPASE